MNEATNAQPVFRRDLIVIGASAGGVEVLRTIVEALPATLPAAVCIVLHVGANRSVLPDILARATKLHVAHATDGEPLRKGRIYVAPPDMHLTIAPGGALGVSRSAKENLARPAIDPLFRTAAVHHGARTVAVICTGALDDGVAGLLAIARCGGVTIVQDPADAYDPTLPTNALSVLTPTRVLPAAGIGPVLVSLAGTEVATHGVPDRRDRKEVELMAKSATPAEMDELGKRSVLTCPECHGTMWELDEPGAPRFRCHTGHAFSARTLMTEQGVSVEAALWAAIRALRENAELATRLATRARGGDLIEAANKFAQRAETSNEQADVLTGLLHQAPAA